MCVSLPSTQTHTFCCPCLFQRAHHMSNCGDSCHLMWNKGANKWRKNSSVNLLPSQLLSVHLSPANTVLCYKPNPGTKYGVSLCVFKQEWEKTLWWTFFGIPQPDTFHISNKVICCVFTSRLHSQIQIQMDHFLINSFNRYMCSCRTRHCIICVCQLCNHNKSVI